MDEKKTQPAKRKGKMISSTTVQLVSGRVPVRWDMAKEGMKARISHGKPARKQFAMKYPGRSGS